MKKIIQTIKLHKLKTEVNKECIEKMDKNNYLVLFKDDTCKYVYTKDELMNVLSKDHIKPVKYVFNMSDRITVDRNIYIDINEMSNN